MRKDAKPTTQRPPGLARPLLRWYRRVRRDLPWRRTADPYAIWLSESMLQQTQVATVIPYYEKFLRRFPTLNDLASAPLDAVLSLWAGLGYYARARNLHLAAGLMVSRFGGRVPDTLVELRSLPGVGAYTAGAVASIAFGRRAAVVDGNVARVLARLFAIRDDLKRPTTRSRLWELADALLPARRCGDFNQALMELGATMCTPRTPRCQECPLAAACAARRMDCVDAIPAPARRATVREESHVVAAIEHAGQWLFIRRPERGLWGGLWELPSAQFDGTDERAAALALAREWSRHITDPTTECCARLRHELTHRSIAMAVYRFESARSTITRKSTSAEHPRSCWRRLDEAGALGLSRAMARVVSQLRTVAPDLQYRSRADRASRPVRPEHAAR